MQLLFLNLWNGKVADPLRTFLGNGDSFDVVCFQEFAGDGESIVRATFPKYNLVSAEKHAGYKSNFSVATLVHPQYKIEKSVELLQSDDEVGLALALEIQDPNGRSITIVNVHGTARKRENGQFLDTDGKLDFPALLQYLEERSDPKIIGGDFNMLPEAKSIQAFVKVGYRDLIREYAIPTTRNHFSWDRYPNSPYLFSDYVFTDSTVLIKSFSVPDVEVSDHLPMILEIE